MKNDTACPLSLVADSSSGSLSSRVLSVYGRARLVYSKTPMRLCVQVSLTPDHQSGGGRSPIELWHHISDQYIAISCPWYLPGHDTVSGRYRFAPEQPSGVIMPPDIVLDRILNFKVCNPDYLHTPFWIDKVCINQDASEEKEMAVQSMDLVYQYSGRKVVLDGQERWVGCSLGLLFVKIETVAELTMLRRLLDGKFAENNNNEPRHLVPVEEAVFVLDLIEKILSDNWWHRAWIFQEEFLASTHMILLVPCTLDRMGLFETDNGVDRFGKTEGEIQVWPLNFRTCVTELCLALYRHVDKAGQDRCSEILKYTRRYTFLYRSKFAAGSSSIIKAMSPAIFEDIGTRGITVPSDILAITANCCRYLTRLSPQILNETNESLSIAILTLFVMNGEILRHDVHRAFILKKPILECLHTAKLQVHPPVPAGELIFIKICRFPTVTMMASGLMVKGVLSRLDQRIKVKVPPSDQDLYWQVNDVTQTNTLNAAERCLLKILAKHLHDLQRKGQGGDALHTMVIEFLDEEEADKAAGRRFQYWSLRHVQLLMAKAVCRAMVEGRALWLSRLHLPRRWTPWLGIFIPDDSFGDSGVVNSFAFTARGTDHEFKDRGAKLARKNAWYNSLEVRFDPATDQIRPKKWLNGFHFFNSKEHARDFVIPWPQWMQQLP